MNEIQQYNGVNSLVNVDKKGIAAIADNIVAQVNDGYIDPLEALIHAKKLREIAETLEKQVRPIAEGLVTIPKGEAYKKFNVEVTQSETGVSYSFAECNDPQWDRLKEDADIASAGLKERETTLKTITKPIPVLDPETGEVTTVNPPVRRAKLGLKLSVK